MTDSGKPWSANNLVRHRAGGGDLIAIKSKTPRSSRYVRAFGQQIYDIQSSGDVGGRKPSVLLHGLNDLSLVEEPLDQTWSKFFPGVEGAKRKSYRYPLPYTDEFCHLYAEPLSSFVRATQLFAGAVEHIASARAADVSLASEALESINLLRRPNQRGYGTGCQRSFGTRLAHAFSIS